MAGSTRQRGAQRLKEYEFPAFSQAESIYFSSEASWQDLDAKLARTGLRRLGFGADFPISKCVDHHTLSGFILTHGQQSSPSYQ